MAQAMLTMESLGHAWMNLAAERSIAGFLPGNPAEKTALAGFAVWRAPKTKNP